MFKSQFALKIFSLTLMLLSVVFFMILFTFAEQDSSYNSIAFGNEQGSLYILRNIIADSLLQYLGFSIYLLPIILILWSYLLYLGYTIKFILLKIILLFFVLITMPALIYSGINEYSAGILGAFLSHHIALFVNYSYIFWIVIIILLLFISSVSAKHFVYILNMCWYLLSLALNNLIVLFSNIKAKIFSYNAKDQHKSSNVNIKLTPNKQLYSYSNENESTTEYNELAEEDKTNINDTLVSNKATNNTEEDSLYLEEIKKIREKYYLGNTNKHIEKNIESEVVVPKASVIENSINEELQSYGFKDVHNNEMLNEEQIEENVPYEIPLSFLSLPKHKNIKLSTAEINTNAMKLEQIIQEFGIGGKIVNIMTGPVVTLYEINIPAGVKTAKLISLETDIALRMKAISVRIAVVPGKDVVGIEIPNAHRKTVFLKEVLQSSEFVKSEAKLPIALGFDINGKSVVADLTSMPHVLIAGTTGSGKSVGINGMILSILYKLSPEQCKLIMIDPKMLELSVYQDIPHLLTPVVTNPKQAISALKWAVKEMEYRYYQMSLLGVRNITGFNEKIKDTNMISKLQESLKISSGVDIAFSFLPYIVVIIDEMADLMIVAGKEVESAVQRLAQMARAAGIHVIMATQRPSVDVITGTIKANFPTRISFQVSSKIDSRTILGDQGAEQLLGRGDMLYMSGVGRIQRIHGPFISDDEVLNVVKYLKKIKKPSYINNITTSFNATAYDQNAEETDELYNDAIAVIQEEGKVSTSFLQRKFQIGYNRAARIVEQLEENGVVSKATATGKREILIK